MITRRRKKSRIDPSLRKKINVTIILGLVTIFIFIIIDAIPLVYSRLAIESQVKEMATAASSAVVNKPINSVSASKAYGAALFLAQSKGWDIKIVPESFTLNADGTISMTAFTNVKSNVIAKYPPFADVGTVTEFVYRQGPALIR